MMLLINVYVIAPPSFGGVARRGIARRGNLSFNEEIASG
jgi:hypothetical protein